MNLTNNQMELYAVAFCCGWEVRHLDFNNQKMNTKELRAILKC